MTPYYSPAPLGNNTHASQCGQNTFEVFERRKIRNILLKNIVEANSRETIVDTNGSKETRGKTQRNKPIEKTSKKT